MLRTNLEAEQIPVTTTVTATDCLAALQYGSVAALVVDADLLRDTAPDGPALRAYLGNSDVPALLLSWDPSDRLLARELGDILFLSRMDDIERVLESVHGLLAPLPG